MWTKSESSSMPVELDTSSSKKYNYVRKNITPFERTNDNGEVTTAYSYDELKVSKDDWPVFEQVIEHASQISQMQTDIRNNGTTTASEWKANEIINANEYISYNGALYYCLVTNKGIVPTDTRYYRSTDVASELNNLLRRINA